MFQRWKTIKSYNPRLGSVKVIRQNCEIWPPDLPGAIFDTGNDADALPLLERRLQPLSVGEGELQPEANNVPD